MFTRQTLSAVLLLFAVAGTDSAFASEQAALTGLLDKCTTKRLAQDKPVGLNKSLSLKQHCPELLSWLENPLLADFSPRLEEKTSLTQLLDIARLLRSRTTKQHNPGQLDHAGLQALLNEVYVPAEEQKEIKNFVDLFWDWVRKKLSEYFEGDNWFKRTFDFDTTPGDGFYEGLKNTTIVILIAFMLYIIINELYAANISKYFARRKARKTAAQHHAETGSKPIQDLSDILQLPLRQQIPALLRYSLQLLIKKELLPAHYSLTNQEFLSLARQQVPEASRDLEFIINSSDKVLYGNKSIAAGDASLLFDRVKNLEHLDYRKDS